MPRATPTYWVSVWDSRPYTLDSARFALLDTPPDTFSTPAFVLFVSNLESQEPVRVRNVNAQDGSHVSGSRDKRGVYQTVHNTPRFSFFLFFRNSAYHQPEPLQGIYIYIRRSMRLVREKKGV